MKIYLAGRYGRHVELETCAADLRFDGHTVTSRWHKGEHQALDGDLVNNPELAQRFAVEDFDDLMDAGLCISFTEHPHALASRGGRHVEFGMAYARGLQCWIVGPHENVFHHLPNVVQFDSWPHLLHCGYDPASRVVPRTSPATSEPCSESACGGCGYCGYGLSISPHT